uniref:Cilia- and flagella-associated protein 300 n=1 Tax=Hucho hucho TaxID=62062 RepID=A0A4W5LBM1_9TELE
MASENSRLETEFSFNLLPTKTFSFLQDKNTLQLLMKWSMLGRISAQAFSFDQTFYPYNSHDFTLSFFRDPCVLTNLRKMEAGAWVTLEGEVVCVQAEVVPCSKVSMEMFDPLYSSGIITPSGHITKCFHDTHPDYDLLRQMLQEDGSEEYGVMERREFLFLLFKHVTLGGELCQYEDTINPYIDTTRTIYRDLVRYTHTVHHTVHHTIHHHTPYTTHIPYTTHAHTPYTTSHITPHRTPHHTPTSYTTPYTHTIHHTILTHHTPHIHHTYTTPYHTHTPYTTPYTTHTPYHTPTPYTTPYTHTVHPHHTPTTYTTTYTT